MSKKGKADTISEKGTPEHWKNERKFRLLVLLPCFQNDVRVIRKELKIPDGGLTDEGFQVWYEKYVIAESDAVTNNNEFNKKLKEIHALQIKNHGEYLKQQWLINDTIPINRLNNRIESLGKKYNLPANFYDPRPIGGLFAYVTRNVIVPPPNNWAIQMDPSARENNRASWVAIKTYAPLSNREFENAKQTLVEIQKNHFYKGVTVNQRARKQFERDVEIFNELAVQRKKKPTRKKIHGGYLSYIKNPVERKKWERLHPLDVTVGFDEITSKEIGKKFKMTPDAVRKALHRIIASQIELFGEENLGR